MLHCKTSSKCILTWVAGLSSSQESPTLANTFLPLVSILLAITKRTFSSCQLWFCTMAHYEEGFAVDNHLNYMHQVWSCFLQFYWMMCICGSFRQTHAGHYILRVEAINGLRPMPSAQRATEISAQQNQMVLEKPRFKLAGLAIGNGLTAPATQATSLWPLPQPRRQKFLLARRQ